jgi:hypothetical protein
MLQMEKASPAPMTASRNPSRRSLFPAWLSRRPKSSSNTTHPLAPKDTTPFFDLGNSFTKIRDQLVREVEDLEATLRLQGSYNPYLRVSPWPPTHINVNYLMDPRTVGSNMGYSSLYDFHKEGSIATNRADSLLIPGLAAVPFNPRELPVPPKEKPWWRIISDFYRNEL